MVIKYLYASLDKHSEIGTQCINPFCLNYCLRLFFAPRLPVDNKSAINIPNDPMCLRVASY